MSNEALALVGLTLVPVALSKFGIDRLRPLYLSPPKLLVGFMAVFGVGGYLLTGDDGRLIGSDLKVADQLLLPAIRTLLLSAVCAAVGALLYAWARPRLAAFESLQTVQVSSRGRVVLGLVAVVPLLLYATAPGFILERTTYTSAGAGSVFVAVARNLTIVAVFAMGFLWPSARPPVRVLLGAGTLLYWAIIFAQASRQFALTPLFFALGALAATLGRREKRNVAIAGVAALLLIPIPLYMRGQTRHGLFPYMDALPGFWDVFLAEPLRGLANVFFGFPVLALTLFRAPNIPSEFILIELSPLTGNAAGWYEIADRMRINPAVPYSSLGEIAGAGLLAMITFWTFVGMFLAHIDRRIGRLLADGQQLFALTMLGFSTTFVVFTSQYNLRNSFRVLVYLLLLDIATRIWMIYVRSADRSVKPSDERPGEAGA